MEKFKYEGYDKDAVFRTGELEAENYADAYHALEFQGLTTTKLSQDKPSVIKILSEYYLRWRLGGRWQSIFFRELSVMLGVMNLQEVLSTLLRTERESFTEKILREMLKSIEVGETFTQALKRHEIVFGSDAIQSVEVGETGGKLQTVTAQLADRLERNYTTRRKVSSAMYYPIVVLLAAFIAAMVMVNVTLPVFEDFYKGQGGELPLITSLLFAFGKFLTEHFVLVIFLSAILVIMSIAIYHRVEAVKFSADKLKWQLKIFREAELRNLFGRLNFLLESGITLNEALRLCRQSNGNLYVKKFLSDMQSAVELGEGFSEVVKKNIPKLSPLYLGLLVSGESSGELSEMLSRCEAMADFEIEEVLRELPTKAEVYGTLTAGIIVGALVFAIVLPILNMTSLF